MKIYLVWARASAREYDVIVILESEEKAKRFIEENAGEIDNGYMGNLDEGDFSIEEREIGVPKQLDF